MGKLSGADVLAGQHLPGWGCHRYEATLRPRAGMGWCLSSQTPLTWGLVTGTMLSRYDNLEAEKPAREAWSWGLVSPFPSIPGTPPGAPLVAPRLLRRRLLWPTLDHLGGQGHRHWPLCLDLARLTAVWEVHFLALVGGERGKAGLSKAVNQSPVRPGQGD